MVQATLVSNAVRVRAHLPGVGRISHLNWNCRWLLARHLSSNDSFKTANNRSSTKSDSAPIGEDESELLYLVDVDGAVLTYPGSSTKRGPWNFTVSRPSRGGHALLGRNGSGKSLVANALVHNGGNGFVESGNFRTEQPWRSTSIARVSFESHEKLLERGGTVSKAIADGGNLTKAAQFLVVRFGMFPLLHRDVRTLSTGEIRKVMIVRALSNRPRLLILDNAFDGLDVPSREILKDLVSKTIQGFRVDILVQAVSAKEAAHTQILLLTHREEELVEEVETVSIIEPTGALQTFSSSAIPAKDALARALGMGTAGADRDDLNGGSRLPTLRKIAEMWNGRTSQVVQQGPIVQASNLRVTRGGATLLRGLDWTVLAGQRWLVAGGNGQGKSTLSRMLARWEDGIAEGSLTLAASTSHLDTASHRTGVGWVSTELHMETARSSQSGFDVLRGTGCTEENVASVSSWIGLDVQEVLSRPFSELSQGQQKLVLIAAAIACRPDVLVLDEPCQGLDYVNRQRVLGLVDRLCQASDVTLIYITHHLEEVIPSITHVLHLSNGTAAYNGTINEYDPANL